MKANELRIGNLAIVQGIKKAITGWDIYCADENKAGIDINIDTIPLDEQLLLKFGFEKHITGCFIKGYAAQGELIIFDSSTPVAKANDIKEGEYYYMFHRSAHMLQHVHQLQNLYFALTGNELIAK